MRFLLLVCAFLAASLPAVAADDYVFILSSRGNPFWQSVSDGVRDAAKERGIEARIMMTGDDRASEEQLNDCENAITMKPKAIIMASLNPPAHIGCLKKAQDAGIVIGDMDSNITVQKGKENGLNLAFSVGSDNEDIGGKAAGYAAGLFQGDAPKILIIEGAPGSNTGRKRVSGFTNVIKKHFPKARIVASTSGEWDRLKAMTLTTDTLQRVPDLSIIYAANDMMALGAGEALKIAGKTNDVILIGVDGIAEAREAVKAGKMTATVAQLPYLIGRRAVELAVEAVNGKPKNDNEVTPAPVLTKDTMALNKDSLLEYVR